MKNFLKKYSHAWTLIYIVFYMPWFIYLENNVKEYTLIHTNLDYQIPFCEYFIIPYFLWFPFVGITFVYFLFYSKTEYYQLCAFLFTGMTIFLIICTVWPNGLDLRSQVVERNNIFSHLVSSLQKADTSANVFPSLHVFNTLGCMIALFKSKGLEKKYVCKTLIWVLSVSIILSTVFLKQHSIIDVLGGFGLAAILYVPVYVLDYNRLREKKTKTSDVGA